MKKQVTEEVEDKHKPTDPSLCTTREIKDQRLATCKQCEHHMNGLNLLDLCTKCGCVLQWKTWLNRAECPVGKW
jgi:hypothetical protein